MRLFKVSNEKFNQLHSLNGVFTNEASSDEIIIDVERAGNELMEMLGFEVDTEGCDFIHMIVE